MTRGLRVLSALDRPIVRTILRWPTSLGMLGLVLGIGLVATLGFISPDSPVPGTGQVQPWQSHGDTLYVRRIELMAMNVGIAVCGSMFFIGSLVEHAIFGPLERKAPYIVLIALMALASVAVLFVFVRAGGAWPYPISP